jgi:hypothetical protein
MFVTKGKIARLLARTPVSSRFFGPPRGYAKNLSSLSLLECKDLALLKPEREVKNVVPRLPTEFRELQEEMDVSYASLPAPSQHLYQLPESRVLGEAYAHGVVTNADRFVLDQHETWGQTINNHPIHYTLKLPRCIRLRGTSFSLISNWSDNYYHWIFDVLGKLLLFIENPKHNTFQMDRYLVLNLSKYPFKRQSLLHLGFSENQLIDVTQYSHFLCEKLLLADRPHPHLFPELDVITALRGAFLPKKITDNTMTDALRRIYISRSKISNRRIVNETEVILRLEKLGFKEVILESMNFLDQVELFRNAEVVIAPHGASLSNLVFCNPGTQVFELFEPEYFVPCYAYLSAKLSLNYHPLLSGPAKGVFKGTWTDIPKETKVDVNDFINILTQALES